MLAVARGEGEEKPDSSAEEDRDLAKVSVQVRPHAASVAVTEGVWRVVLQKLAEEYTRQEVPRSCWA